MWISHESRTATYHARSLDPQLAVPPTLAVDWLAMAMWKVHWMLLIQPTIH